MQLGALGLRLANLLGAGVGFGPVRDLLLLDLPAPEVKFLEQGHLERAVDGLGEDLLPVGEQVVDAGGGEEGVGAAGLDSDVGG